MATSGITSSGPGDRLFRGRVARAVAPLAGVVALLGCSPEVAVDSHDSGAALDARDGSPADAASSTDVTLSRDAAMPADAAMSVDASCPARSQAPDGSVELASIPSNFDTTGLIWPPQMVPPDNSPDVLGAFRFICNASHEGFDDPIVLPCQPGASHLHEFFGNTLTNSFSTYESLRTTGDSTCTNALNRSSYWIPAMLNGRGRVVRPDYAAIYYKRYPENSPLCQQQGSVCVPMPRGLRMVFGYDFGDPTGGMARGYFNCDGPTATPGHYPDIVAAAANCPNGNRLGAVLEAPDCWDGFELDSADHRSHLAYPSYGDWGYLKCPATHPYVIPTFTIGVWYTVDDDLDRSGQWGPGISTWFLSSDSDNGPTTRPGTTLHGDWFGAWDDDIMNTWMTHCINEFRNCAGGQLGDGTGLTEFPGFTWNANPRVVDPPAP